MLLVAALVFVGAVLFVRSLFVRPQLRLPASIRQLQARLRTLQHEDASATPKAVDPVWLRFRGHRQEPGGVRFEHGASSRSSAHNVRLGFCTAWDPDRLDALQTHADQLTHVASEWMTILDGRGTLSANGDANVMSLARARGLAFLPILNNLVEDS